MENGKKNCHEEKKEGIRMAVLAKPINRTPLPSESNTIPCIIAMITLPFLFFEYRHKSVKSSFVQT